MGNPTSYNKVVSFESPSQLKALNIKQQFKALNIKILDVENQLSQGTEG